MCTQLHQILNNKKKEEKLQVLEYRISFEMYILYAGKHKVGLSFLFPNDWGN